MKRIVLAVFVLTSARLGAEAQTELFKYADEPTVFQALLGSVKRTPQQLIEEDQAGNTLFHNILEAIAQQAQGQKRRNLRHSLCLLLRKAKNFDIDGTTIRNGAGKTIIETALKHNLVPEAAHIVLAFPEMLVQLEQSHDQSTVKKVLNYKAQLESHLISLKKGMLDAPHETLLTTDPVTSHTTNGHIYYGDMPTIASESPYLEPVVVNPHYDRAQSGSEPCYQEIDQSQEPHYEIVGSSSEA